MSCSLRGLLIASVYLSCASAETIAFQNVNIVDPATGELLPSRTILVVDSTISSAGTNPTSPRDAKVVDCSGKFAIPGLWDMHVHLDSATELALPVLIANGVTHVRDMGTSNLAELKRWRSEIASSQRIGPDIYLSGPILESARWLDRAKTFLTPEELAGRIPVGLPSDADTAVARLAAMGVDFVKIRTVASKPVYLAIAEACQKHGLDLVGHSPSPTLGLVEAAEAGHRCFEHTLVGSVLGKRPDDMSAAIETFESNGTHFVPTLVAGVGFRFTPEETVDTLINDDGTLDPRNAYAAPALKAFWKRQMEMKNSERSPADWPLIHRESIAFFADLHKAGIPLMTGTDLGGVLIYPGYSLHDELARFVDEIGLSPAAALASATAIPARFIKKDAQFGLIEADKAADFVILNKNPLDDIRNTRGIFGLVLNGRWFDRAALDTLLQESRNAIAAQSNTL